jgi:Protein of unknown function (DUF3263)
MASLTDQEKALLDFAARWYRFPGAQEQAMRDELGLSATTCWRKVNDLIDRPEALAYAPTTAGRLRRMRDQRLAARSARGLIA